MKKLTQALLLSLAVAAPAAMFAPQVQANPFTSQQQAAKASSNQELAADTAGTKAYRRCYVNKMGRRVCRVKK